MARASPLTTPSAANVAAFYRRRFGAWDEGQLLVRDRVDLATRHEMEALALGE